MPKLTTEVYLLEINRLCEYAIYSVSEMNKSLKNYELGVIDLATFWYYAHSFLSHSSNISKFLWGGKVNFSKLNKVQKRKANLYNDFRKKLRKILEINEKAALKSRAVRNLFEHFDEHILDLTYVDNSVDYTDMCIGKKENFDVDQTRIYRFYDVEEKTITIYDKVFDVSEILGEVYQILGKTKNILEQDGM
ncbi:hypothetical protein [Peribacillus sp. NPDC097295]|uniref:hypothetical protein n=1 Tax=Peribacillus sp. NPDC097295 TaxID=3364402 RepID=UPI0038051B74